MKAFLLAAGKGTRLQPLTFHTPKCLVPIEGRPLIEYWFDLFELYGIDEILINTSHLAETVHRYLADNSRGLEIKVVYEETLRGSGGTIDMNRAFIEGEESFYIFYADNLTNINLDKLSEFHKEKGKDTTLALFHVPNPKECGIVELDGDGTVISFTEKPDNPVSDLAFAGIIVTSPRILDFFPDDDFFDLGHDVLPLITGNSAGYVMDDYLLDIGTPEKLSRAEKDVKNGKIKLVRKLNTNRP